MFNKELVAARDEWMLARAAGILKDIKTLYRFNEKIDLVYAETLLIKHEQPQNNSQRERELRILKVF